MTRTKVYEIFIICIIPRIDYFTNVRLIIDQYLMRSPYFFGDPEWSYTFNTGIYST